MKKFLITGVGSGLGKYLLKYIPNSTGLDRNNFNLIKYENFDTIIHCAFNKENIITDYSKYLSDNIFLTQNLKQIDHTKLVYISTVDVYQENPTMYAQFKRFAETLILPKDLILRCPMMLGDTMKHNHITKLKDNVESIGLSGESEFSYLLMDDLVNFFVSGEYEKYMGIVDFVPKGTIKLKHVKKHFNSTTQLGNYVYKNSLDYVNPIYTLNSKYNKTALDNLIKYYE
jgi:nucleoside-diphosphate-sugar epimerase